MGDRGVGEGRTNVPPRRSLLWHRDFRLLWTGETASQFGDAVNIVALPLVAINVLHAGTFVVGVVAGAAWVPWAFLGLPVGALVDRTARRPIMLVSNVVSALLFASVPLAVWGGVLTIAQLIVVALLAGAAAVFFSIAYQAYLPSVVGVDDLIEGNAKLQGSASAAQVSGPGLGGAVVQVAGAANCLLVNAASFVASAVFLLRIRAVESVPACADSAPEGGGRRLRHEVAEGLRFVLRDPYLRPATVFAAGANLPLAGVDALLVLFLVRTVRVNAGLVGAALAAIGLGGLVGALMARRVAQRLGAGRAMIACTSVTLPFGLLTPLTGQGPELTFVIGYMIASAGIIAFNVIYVSFRQSYCPPHLLGRVGAAYMTIGTSCSPVGALVAGALGATIGVRPTLWLMTGSLTAASLILVFSRLRTLPRDARPAVNRPAG